MRARNMKDDKRLKRKVRNSYIVSTVSITLVLFLLGSVGYLMTAAMKIADTLQESISGVGTVSSIVLSMNVPIFGRILRMIVRESFEHAM